MNPGDTTKFQTLLESLHSTFGGREVTQATVDTYWHALKDLQFSIIERVAAQHVRYGKFFPKPVELRPREERAPAMIETGDIQVDADRRAVLRMDWERVDHPVQFAIEFNVAFCAKQLGSLLEGQPGYRQALAEDRYWRDMQGQPFAEQCLAVPTFAAEHEMTRAQRIERMKYIQDKRAAGIKANQLSFPRVVAARIPPEATRGPD